MRAWSLLLSWLKGWQWPSWGFQPRQIGLVIRSFQTSGGVKGKLPCATGEICIRHFYSHHCRYGFSKWQHQAKYYCLEIVSTDNAQVVMTDWAQASEKFQNFLQSWSAPIATWAISLNNMFSKTASFILSKHVCTSGGDVRGSYYKIFIACFDYHNRMYIEQCKIGNLTPSKIYTRRRNSSGRHVK